MAGGMINVVSANWGTPIELFQQLEAMFGKFDLDAAASDNWSMCPNYITKEMDALNPNTPWNGTNIFLNPPYGRMIPKFLNRVLQEIESPEQPAKSIICLLPAKTDTKWFHDIVYKFASEIIFIKGRLKFRTPSELNARDNTAMFSSMIACFGTKCLFKANQPLIWSMSSKE